MRETEQIARTVEEAVEQGLQLLGVKREQVEVQIMEEPSGGLFGLGAKQARVRVIVKEVDIDKGKKLLEDILALLELDGMVDVDLNDAEDTVRYEISGPDLGLLIGRRGQTLNSLQFLLAVVLTRGMEGRRIKCVVDVEGYRARREKSLQTLAEDMARTAIQERRSISLEPMSAYERRVIHMTLQGHPRVVTASHGDEPRRKVVISPKEMGSKSQHPYRGGRPQSRPRSGGMRGR